MDLRELRYFVAVAEELHFGRAAARLHMTQPPLSRAIKRLEADLGAALLHRSSTAVTLTPAGSALHAEACALLAQADLARARVAATAGAATLTIGTLADSAAEAGTELAAAFRLRHPEVRIVIREADLTDPSTGLRAGLVDVALTRAPFDHTGIATHVLRRDPVGVVLRADDPLAGREVLHLHEIADRRWFQMPESADPIWRLLERHHARRPATRRAPGPHRARVPAGGALERHGRADAAGPRPARRPHRSPADRHARQRTRDRLEPGQPVPAGPLVRADRRSRPPSSGTAGTGALRARRRPAGVLTPERTTWPTARRSRDSCEIWPSEPLGKIGRSGSTRGRLSMRLAVSSSTWRSP